jgi:hypothetical protein
MVPNRLGDKKGTNLSNVVRFNEAMKTHPSPHCLHLCMPRHLRASDWDILIKRFEQIYLDCYFTMRSFD